MKNLLRVAVVCGLSLMTTGKSVWAQEPDNRYGVNSTAIKLGFYSPGSGAARRGGGSQILNIEGDLTIQSIPERNETGVISVGYIERDNLRIIPLTLSQVIHKTAGYDYFYGYGIGLYSARLNLGGATTTSGATKTLIGAHALIGVNLSATNFVEAKYLYPGRYDDQFIGGLQIMFGRRL